MTAIAVPLAIARTIVFHDRIHTSHFTPQELPALRQDILQMPQTIVFDQAGGRDAVSQKLAAFRMITRDHMPPPSQLLVELIDTAAFAQNLTSRSSLFKLLHINSKTGRAIVSGRAVHTFDWLLWVQLGIYAGLLKAPVGSVVAADDPRGGFRSLVKT